MNVPDNDGVGGGLRLGKTVDAAALRAIVSWCEALSGSIPLAEALAALVQGLGAEAGLIVRTQLRDPHPTRIATCDLLRGVPARPLHRSFADSYFGGALGRARPGTIWQARAHADDATGDPALPEWQAARRLTEFLVLVLASNSQSRDHIELHFRDPISPDTENSLHALLPDMVRVWSHRRVGLITRTIVNHRLPGPRMGEPAPRARILGDENPMRLSRAEFRVCVLLGTGLNAQAVAQELGLSEATIRTHLRNIYQKTGCGSLAELVFRIMDGGRGSDAYLAISA